MNYYDRSLDALMHAYGRYDVTFDHGDGIHLYDVNQKEYIDFFSGIGVNSFGYNYPAYVEAMEKQLHRLMHISNYFNTVETIEAAECVKKATKLDKVFFTNSGAESTEGALKLARKYYYQKHGKADSEIISLNHSFHGRTTGSVKLTGNAHYQEAFGPLIEGVKYAEINDLDSVKALLNEKTAAIIVEPVQGEGGVYVCSKEFLTGLRKLCDERDIALILDEVQCGMGRTGTIMTYFQYDILPDILCLAKGIGAGFPMGAFVANKKFAAAMEPGDHGSTYGGNPMAGQACRTVFKILNKLKGNLILYTVILLAITLFNTTSGNMNHYEATKPDILIVNKDQNNEITKGFVSYLKEQATLKDIDINDQEKVDDALFYRDVSYVVYIPENFGDDLVNDKNPTIEYKSNGNENASFTQMLIEKYIKTVNLYKEHYQGKALNQKVKQVINQKTKVKLNTSLDISKLNQVNVYFNFLNYALLAGGVYCMTMILASLNQEGVRKRTIMSSFSYRKYNWIVFASLGLASFIVWLTYMIISFI